MKKALQAAGLVRTMMAMEAVIRRWGIPGSWYTDRAGWAVYSPKAGGPYDPERLTQVAGP